MDNGNLRWWAAGAFAVLAVLQAAKWGSMGLQIQAPLLLILVLGLVVAGFRESLPFRNHALFVFAYGAIFLLLWAVGHPMVELVPGRTWLVTVAGLAVLAGVLVWNLRGQQGMVWLLALVLATGFGLFIAYASGPKGATPWLQDFYLRLFGLPASEWQTAQNYVVATRKSLHFIGYGATALATAHVALRVSGNLSRSVLFAYLWALPIAVFDEYQQRFSPGTRTGQVSDVVLDFCGMSAFLFVFWLANRRPEIAG